MVVHFAAYLRFFNISLAFAQQLHYFGSMSSRLGANSIPVKTVVTLRKIAAQMDVDVGTVSRALAGDSRLSRERVEQIRAFAQVAGYRPKPLRRKQTDAIGLVVRATNGTKPQTGYLERMVYLAEVGASRLNKHLHVHMLGTGEEGSDWPKFIAENRVDGIIVLGHATTPFYERLRHEPVPAVAINDTVDQTNIDCVMCDPTPGVQQAVRELLGLGHRHIGLVLTQRQYPTVSRRHSAYMNAMHEEGIEPEANWIVQEVPDGLRGGQQAVRTYAAMRAMPTAILFNDDWVAMGGVYELARQGLSVPNDVSVVGYDNTAIATDLAPSLSSIDNQEQHLMSCALEMLQERISGLAGAPRQITVQSQLVGRESCGVVPPSRNEGTL